MAVIENRDGKQYIKIPVPKATQKGEEAGFVEVCIDDLPNDVLIGVYFEGCKKFVNMGMTKLTGPKSQASREEAIEIAQANVQKMYEGKVRLPSGVRTKVKTGALRTEAMRIARLEVKDALKRAGEKVSYYSAKDISALATEYLESEAGEAIMQEAADNLKKREEGARGGAIDISKIKPDPTLKAKGEAKKAKQKAAGVGGVVAQQHRPGGVAHSARH